MKKYNPGTTGWAIIQGRKYWANVEKVNRKGYKVRYNKSNPSSSWQAADVTTTKEFEARCIK